MFNTVGHYKAISAKTIGGECTARDVTIYNKPAWAGTPFGVYKWTADCLGRRYQCGILPEEKPNDLKIHYGCTGGWPVDGNATQGEQNVAVPN